MRLQFKNTDKRSKHYRTVKAIYNTAFPDEERAPIAMLMQRKKQGKGEFLTVFDGDEVVGMVYLVSDEKVAYLFYFAVAKSKRKRGYGSAILTALKAYCKDKKLFLALERTDEDAPNLPERIARRAFYERNGFVVIPRAIQEATVVFDTMSVGGVTVEPEEYAAVMRNWADAKLLERVAICMTKI